MKSYEFWTDAGDTAQIWQALTDLESYPAWNPLVRQAEGTLERGGALTLRLARYPRPVTATVTTLKPRREMIWKLNGPVPSRLIWRMEAGTRLVLIHEWRGVLLPAVALLLDVLYRPLYRRTGDALRQYASREARHA
jgi:hypothetical protein